MSSIALLVAGMALTANAGAVQDARLPHGLELGPDAGLYEAPRLQRITETGAPPHAVAAYAAFKSDVGGRWVASWDRATGVPSRIFGTGVAAPGTSLDEPAAAAFARAFLARHQALLAPGTSSSDFVLVSNVSHRGVRTVAFVQRHGGLEVRGGQLSFRFKNDRLVMVASEALPHVALSAPTTTLADAELAAAAESWVETDFAAESAVATSVGQPLVLPVLSATSVAYRVVVPVIVETSGPVGRWEVFLDPRDGARIAREQTLRFATGTLRFNAPMRWPGSDRADFTARNLHAEIGGQTVTSGDDASVTFADGGPVDVTLVADGIFASVNNGAGADASATFSLAPDGEVVWEGADNPQLDAQLNAYVHTQLVKDYVRVFAPEMTWLDGTLPVNVNLNDTCNAFYDGSSINFYSQSNNCENTGRLADVVYHEVGHGVHHHAIVLGSGTFESALSEGVSDYLAATITDDAAMGRGFFYSAAPLRHIDPSDGEAVWPQDIQGDPHGTGLIIGGALWDLRKLLVAKHGAEEGVAIADRLFYDAMRNAADIPSMYPEILVADDDDGDLENGTPNVCEIVEAFSAHGLRSIEVDTPALAVEPPKEEGFEVTVAVAGLYEECPGDTIADARLVWALERTLAQKNTIEMEGGPNEFTAVIPSQDAGEVIRYRTELNLSVGTGFAFPDNPADGLYQLLVGEGEMIYCTDFESDPEVDGWTHGLLAGVDEEGADDWQWNTPNGSTLNDDPTTAFSGARVFGNDLGHGNYNGLYKNDRTNYADSPTIDVSGFADKTIRLQYRRWLNVEDGFFDRARIYANGNLVWDNLASGGEPATVHHRDREWRFHTVDVTDQIGSDNLLQIRYEIQSDAGLEMGGWTLDDFCIFAYGGDASVGAECGNGVLEVGEQCDDGNLAAGDGCNADCTIEDDGGVGADPIPPGPVTTGGCGCRTHVSDDSKSAWLLALLPLAVVVRRRRRG